MTGRAFAGAILWERSRRTRTEPSSFRLWIARRAPTDGPVRAKFIALSIFLNNSAQRATINALRLLQHQSVTQSTYLLTD